MAKTHTGFGQTDPDMPDSDRLARWQAWLAKSDRLTAAILERRQHQPVNVDALWRAARADLERRNRCTP